MRRLVIALLLALIVSSCASAGRLVIVTLNGTSLDDLLDPTLPNIHRLVQTGATGVMNARTASGADEEVGRYSMEGGCATIGAGTRAAAGIDARAAFNAGDSTDGRAVRDIFVSRYDREPGAAEVLHLEINTLAAMNAHARYAMRIGELGTALHEAGRKTAVVGTSDQGGTRHREASLIVADRFGVVDYGDVGSRLTQRDLAWPYSARTDSGRLITSYKRVLRLADVIVVDPGYTSRAASYGEFCLNNQTDVFRRAALREADMVVGAVVRELDFSKDRIIILSPSPSPTAVRRGDCLPPVIAAGVGIKRGLLYSHSTRTPGILTSADISASVLDFYSIRLPNSFVGRPLSVSGGTVADLLRVNHEAQMVTARQPAMRGLSVYMLVMVIIATAGAIWGRGKLRWPAWAALLPIASMLGVLWLPAFLDTGLVGTIVALVLVTSGILLLGRLLLRSPKRVFAAICAGVVLTVLVDVLRGGELLRLSVMSYSPVEGARYYGIGNEHMGSVIGAAMIFAGVVSSLFIGRERLRMLALVALLLAVTAAIGMPSLGANAGGAMSAAAAVAVGLILWRGKGVSRKYIPLAIIAIPAALGLMLLLDSLTSGASQSHVGRAAASIASGGIGEMFAIIERKAAMNLMLLQYSPWSKLLIGSIAAVCLLLVWKPLGVLGRLRSNRSVYYGILAASVGALAAFLFNDSGVVAGATCFVYVWTAVVLGASQTK